MKTTTRRTALFGPYALDLRSGELRKFRTKVKMGEQAFQILCLLLERPGEMVTREELRARLWADDTFVDFDHGLNSAIQRLRDCLSDSAEKPRWIETVPRRGYRFVGQLEWSDGSASSEILPQTSGESQNRNSDGEGEAQASGSVGISEGLERVKGHGGRIALLVVVALLLFLVAIPLVRRIQGRSSARQALLIRSLAVLPLENLSGDPAQEYFADGMTDEVITMLAKNPSLRVISRTSVMQYKKVHRPLREIAQELGVDGILEGSVGRSGKQVHVTAQLIHAASDTHVWAESFDRDLSDVGSLQNELAQTIAKQVGATTSASGRPERRINPEAHDAYLLGKYYWFAHEYKKSRGYFQKAIDLTGGNFAPPQFGLGAILCQKQEFSQAAALLQRAVDLEPGSAIGKYYLGWAQFGLNRLVEAEKSTEQALLRNPTFAEAYVLLARIHQREGNAPAVAKDLEEYVKVEPHKDYAHRLAEKIQREMAQDTATVVTAIRP